MANNLLQITKTEQAILNSLGLHSPQDVLDFYRRTRREELRDLYCRTMTVMNHMASLA